MGAYRISCHKCIPFWVVLLLCLSAPDASAQHKQPTSTYTHPIWKRKVIRTINLCDTGRAGEQMKLLEKQGKLFPKLLIQQAEKNSIAAWPSIYLDTPLPATQIREMVSTPPVITISDTGNPAFQVLTVTPNEPNYTVNGYRILEEWRYDTYTGKTTVGIVAIAPFRHRYGDDGTYRGAFNLFWVKWPAISDLVISCEKYDTVNDIAKLIWDDYFKDGNMKNEYAAEENYRTKTGWRKNAIQTTNLRSWYPFGMYSECDSNYEVQLGPGPWGVSFEDNNLANLCYSMAVKGRIKAFKNPEVVQYTDSVHKPDPIAGANTVAYIPRWSLMSPATFLSDPFTIEELRYMTRDQLDTVILTNGREDTVVRHRVFSFDNYSCYGVLASWEFDAQSGLTEIACKGVAPIQMPQWDFGRNISIPMFWVRYTDIKDILDLHKEYDVQNSLPWNLWTDRFREKKR